jgi:hypothetical protein
VGLFEVGVVADAGEVAGLRGESFEKLKLRPGSPLRGRCNPRSGDEFEDGEIGKGLAGARATLRDHAEAAFAADEDALNPSRRRGGRGRPSARFLVVDMSGNDEKIEFLAEGADGFG